MKDVVWLPLVYHKELENAYKEALKEINKSSVVEALWEEAFQYKTKMPEIRSSAKMKTLTVAARFQLSQRLLDDEEEENEE